MQVAEQVRQNAKEYSSFVKELIDWQEDVKKAEYKDKLSEPIASEIGIVSSQKVERLRSNDYASWDKFDVVSIYFKAVKDFFYLLNVVRKKPVKM